MAKKKSHRKPTPVPAKPPAYPRPMLVRDSFILLDGPWECFIDPTGESISASSINFNRSINVPFAPETPASGINFQGFLQAVWYRRQFDAPALAADQRLILHFGAVDYEASVWVNGRLAVRHEGGYTPFSADITDLITGEGVQEIVVRAQDDPHDMAKPRGKQDWLESAHSIWYPRTSGIWQSVWMEVAPLTRLHRFHWTSDVASWTIKLQAHLEGPLAPGLQMRVKLTARGTTLASDTFTLNPSQYLGGGHAVSRTFNLDDPGIGDGREFLLWWPHRPTLIDAEVTLLDAQSQIIDTVRSYTAMRSVALQGDRFMLNGMPYYLRLVLNQGYWLESGLTAPNDEAFARDVQLVKAMGFNGVRMHQKIENPRFLYYADTIGLCVWEEMPSAYTFSDKTATRLYAQWAKAIERDISHPCIVAWVSVNESWGVPDLPVNAEQRHLVRGLYHLTKSLDPSRPVIGNDGWEMPISDLLAIHDYDKNPAEIARRYHDQPWQAEQLFASARPGGRALLIDGFKYAHQPVMLTEFGGIAYAKDKDATWGYSRAEDVGALARQYHELLRAVKSCPLLSGFCYTQLTDTYQEANGLLYMDRTPKFAIEEIAVATRGAEAGNLKEEKIEKRLGKV